MRVGRRGITGNSVFSLESDEFYGFCGENNTLQELSSVERQSVSEREN